MTDIRTFINLAREREIIDASVRDTLLSFEREFSKAPASSGLFTGLGEPVDANNQDPNEPAEAPRLIRGFHDVLITIGLLAALGGLWALGSALLVIPAVIVLSEIFVRRQNLALPAFTLTLMMILATGMTIGPMFSSNNSIGGVGVFAGQLAAMALYYWRYRVPIALAGLIWSAFGLSFFVVLSMMGVSGQIFSNNPRLVALVGLVLTIGLFAIAMRFDMKDRLRVTRRSDVAFWLHLVTAPLLLYSVFILLFGTDGFWWSDEPDLNEALAAIGIVTLMVLVGIIIDRRAFVTSGLISLGAALGIITQQTGIEFSSVGAFAFLAVGIIVLLLGTGWQKLRAFVLGAFPDSWQAKLPPVAR